MANFTQNSRPPKRYVTRLGAILTAVLLLSMGILVIANIMGAWPASVPATADVSAVDTPRAVTPAENDSPQARIARSDSGDTIRIYSVVRRIDIVGVSWDYRLLLISLWFGALGSLLHAGSSFVSFVGNRQLVASWLPWYIVRPLLGAGLAAVSYVVARAGLATTGGVPLADVSHFTVAAAAALVGLFTDRATLKLRDVFDALFPRRVGDEHADALGGDESTAAPRITSLSPPMVSVGTDELAVEIVADHVSDDVTLTVDGEGTEFTRSQSGNLTFMLEAGLRASKGTVEVILRSQAGTSKPARLVITP